MNAVLEKEMSGEKERILLVDDEKRLLPVMKLMIESLGYQVTAMTDSREALELFGKNPHGYDLIITDMNMPDMNGDLLAIEAVTIRPEVPVILISGFINSIDDAKLIQGGIKAFIRKPCKMKEMEITIRAVLDGQSH